MTEQPASFFLIVADHDQGFFSVESKPCELAIPAVR
jgi:hypothetical protein